MDGSVWSGNSSLLSRYRKLIVPFPSTVILEANFQTGVFRLFLFS